jgi:hypothetical protein
VLDLAPITVYSATDLRRYYHERMVKPANTVTKKPCCVTETIPSKCDQHVDHHVSVTRPNGAIFERHKGGVKANLVGLLRIVLELLGSHNDTRKTDADQTGRAHIASVSGQCYEKAVDGVRTSPRVLG